jgi:hypothetical protein
MAIRRRIQPHYKPKSGDGSKERNLYGCLNPAPVPYPSRPPRTRTPASSNPYFSWSLVSPASGCQGIIGNLSRNVVPSHQLLHLALVLGDVVAIPLATGIQPVFVGLVEFLLILGRTPSLILMDVLLRSIAVRSCDRVEGRVRMGSRSGEIQHGRDQSDLA